MLELGSYEIEFFLCTLLAQYILFKFRKNHNHGSNIEQLKSIKNIEEKNE